ncbi:3-oxoacyl-[acyl-carrier-protein] reductase [Hippea maritima]|uniref:3-oxoacyl-[acyl-carrier-protein] reductase n=1 Tax=Hippea maritima (strain ATCC 700847 / DSM 10411 / MH2) TaxID=760142 RepID=F2LWZ0_HIPMA|nr:3-oxoacyl-[acyl-carrier-protein] reductase [Hippea maritima]AEA34174.1 3-oxoacyl-(acyl-carrier-protein) reductase [Hippea maritima DSM 10411]
MMFKGSVALVTGASRGIGAQIAYQLAMRGLTVIINYSSSKDKALKLCDKITSKGGKCEAIGFNVADFDGAGEAIKRIANKYGSIDYLINNAGITKDNLIMRMNKEDIDSVIDVNLKGAINCIKHVSKYMIKKRFGVIVNISSIIGLMGNAGQSNYAASKAGLIGLTKSLAKELGGRNIRVNAVAPGYIETDMTAALSEEQKKALMDNIALGRLGSVEDVANLVEFLLSEESSYITGEVINISGGLYI